MMVIDLLLLSRGRVNVAHALGQDTLRQLGVLGD
jgi:hypothetical protein